MEDFKIFKILDVIDKFTILVECGAIEKPYLSPRCDQPRISIAVFRMIGEYDLLITANSFKPNIVAIIDFQWRIHNNGYHLLIQ